MRDLITAGLRNLAYTGAYSVVCSGVSASAAYGTRFVSFLPTQDPLSAAAVGGLTAFIADACCVATVLLVEGRIFRYFCNNQYPKEEAYKWTYRIIDSTSICLGILVGNAAAPTLATLAKKNISRRASALFSLLSILTWTIQANTEISITIFKKKIW